MEGHRCSDAQEVALPGSGGPPSLCHRSNDGVRGDHHGNAVVLGCGYHGSAVVPAERHDQEWPAELSSGRFGMFGGSQFLPHEGSSAQTGYRLDKVK